jgi:hypothetical protein
MPSLPRVEEYLRSLPLGLDSYPAHRQKAVLLHHFARAWPRILDCEELPPPLLAMVRNPPPVTAWIPEVHGTAVALAGRDTSQSDADYLDVAYRINVEMFRGPLYRVMMMMATPGIILRFADSRWETFHRGVKLRVERKREGRADARLVYPTHLVPEPIARLYGEAFRAALDASAGKGSRCVLSSYNSTMAMFELSWN